MQSASVIIETPVPAGKQTTQGGEQSSTRGGLFDSELKQQQQQIDAQRSSDTNSSAEAKSGDEENTKSQETASNKQQNKTDSQQSNTELAPNERSAKADEGEMSRSESEIVVATPEAAEEGIGELDKAAVIAMMNKSLKSKTGEEPAGENSTESAVLSVTEGDIEQEVVTLDTATSSESDSDIVEESGNKLPLEQQNDLLVESDETVQSVSIEEGATSAHVLNAQQPSDEIVKNEYVPDDNETEVEIKSEGGKRTSNEDKVINAGQAPATVNNEPELEVTNAPMASEVVPQVVVSAPSTTNSASVTSTASSNQVGQTSPLTAAANVTTNSAAGQGMGNSDSSGSMAGRQPMATPEMKPLMTEGAEGETKQTTDKTADFLSTLKSISKDGIKGIDASVQAQNGPKSQPQIPQLISQLSSVQSTGQTQGATSTSPVVSSVESTPAMMTIATSMRQQGWDRAMGERLVFMARMVFKRHRFRSIHVRWGPLI